MPCLGRWGKVSVKKTHAVIPKKLESEVENVFWLLMIIYDNCLVSIYSTVFEIHTIKIIVSINHILNFDVVTDMPKMPKHANQSQTNRISMEIPQAKQRRVSPLSPQKMTEARPKYGANSMWGG